MTDAYGIPLEPLQPMDQQQAGPQQGQQQAQQQPAPPLDQIAYIRHLEQQLQQAQSAMSALAVQRASSPNESGRPERPKYHLPGKFTGKIKSGSNAVLEWVYQVERTCSIGGYQGKCQLDYAVLALDQYALQWWLSVEPTRPAWTWEEFKAAIITAFTPVDDITTAREQLDRLRQGKDSAAYYAQRFRQIVNRIPTLPDPERVHRFVSGLRDSVAQQVRIQRPPDLETAMLIATRADDRNRYRYTAAYHSSSADASSAADPMELGSLRARGKPVRQNQRPSLSSKELATLMNEGRCFNCRQTGHHARNCPQRKQGSRAKN
jgi:Retrotransposon gag protein/Zinc knuckle